MTLKPPNPNIEPSFNEDLTPARLRELFKQIQQNQDFFCQQFPVQGGNVAVGSPWVEPSLLNAWENYETGGANAMAAYRRGSDGRVTLRGLLKHSAEIAVNSTIFILPAGFRPSKQLIFPVSANTTSGVSPFFQQVAVAANGEVIYTPVGSNKVTHMSVSVVSFYPD